MKVEQAAVCMNSGHTFSTECELKVESTLNFRTVFTGVSAAGDAASGAERQERLLLMLQELVGRMLALLSGEGEQSSPLADLSGTQTAGTLPLDSAPASGRQLAWTRTTTETFSEHEDSEFSSTGKVLTTDGRALDFKLDLCLSRDFSCARKTLASGTVALRDPLVINFDGSAAELEGTRFEFDLDADGKVEAIPGLSSASGYLAIDRNGDGCVNNGSELFGTRSGDGFADLAALDSDGNHWLDEADAAFDTLRVWQRDESGQSTLSSLRERGVGALDLGSSETPFALKDNGNRQLGQVRASGIYLNEDGSAGSLQQIDLAV
ncbi:MAG: hypothetical protein H6R17_458 [Proteobacteria bacterium]|nr:hypothetical protein [Pseudomonadota bacterium]